VREETGLTVHRCELVTIDVRTNEAKLTLVYRIQVLDDHTRPTAELDEHRWLRLEELTDLSLLPSHWLRIHDAADYNSLPKLRLTTRS
jgi:hypothetical protein